MKAELGFLGQFSAVDQVELRAQVGGTLTSIGFKDGDIVRKGDLLFAIDPAPTRSASPRPTPSWQSPSPVSTDPIYLDFDMGEADYHSITTGPACEH